MSVHCVLGWQTAVRLNTKWSCWPSCNYCYLVGRGITKLVRVTVEQMAVDRYKDRRLFQILRKWWDLADDVSLWVLNTTASSTGNKTSTCTPLEKNAQIIDILTLDTDSCFLCRCKWSLKWLQRDNFFQQMLHVNATSAGVAWDGLTV